MRDFSKIFGLLIVGGLLSATSLAESEITTAPVLPTHSRFELVPQISVVTINDFSLSLPSYRVNYMASLEGIPLVTIALGTPLGTAGDFGFSAHASIGYGARAARFSTLSLRADPPEPVEPQALRLHWIPTIASAKVTYRNKNLPSIRPSISIGSGALFVVQSSATSDLNRTFGIPVLVISPQLNFLDLTALHWLGGFSFGGTWMHGLSRDSRIQSVSLDFGINLIL